MTAVGYRCEVRQRGAEDVTGGSGSSRRTPTSLPELTDALDHVSVRLKLRNDGGGNVIPAACCSANGSASSPAWRSCGPRARDTSRDGLSIAIMRPGQAVDTSPGGPLVRRQQRARSGTSRRSRRSANRGHRRKISPQQPPELRLLLRRPPTMQQCASRSQPARDVAGGS